MSFASYTNDYRGNNPPIQGCFQHAATEKYFEYRWREDGEHGEFAKDFPHLIFVGPTGTETRVAKVGKTVVYVVVDENADGTPVVEKWYTKKFRKIPLLIIYINCDSVYTKIMKTNQGDTKMILKPTPVSSDIFTYANHTFVSELSSFKGMAFGKVFDDACDEGFSIVSKKTGNHVVFAFDSYSFDEDENEMTAMHFKCVTPGYKNLIAVLLND